MMRVENWLLWQSGISNVTTTDGVREGSQVKLTSVVMGHEFELKAVITHNDGRSTFAAVSNRGPITFETWYTLTDIEGGTRVNFTNHINAHGVFRLAEGVLQSVSEAQYEADLRRLKTILESALAPRLPKV